MAKRKGRKKGKGKRKSPKARKQKARRKGTSRRGPISYTPCRNSAGMFTKKVACRV